MDRDTKKKSLLKTVTWTAIVITTSSVLIYLLTGRLLESIGLGTLIELIEGGFYYIHERLWSGYD